MKNCEDFIRHELDKIFVVKPDSIGPQTKYLGNKVSYVTLENGRSAWRFILSQYVQDAVKNVIDTLTQRRGSYLNVENLLGLVTTDLRLTLPMSSLHQEPPTIDLLLAYFDGSLNLVEWI